MSNDTYRYRDRGGRTAFGPHLWDLRNLPGGWIIIGWGAYTTTPYALPKRPASRRHLAGRGGSRARL